MEVEGRPVLQPHHRGLPFSTPASRTSSRPGSARPVAGANAAGAGDSSAAIAADLPTALHVNPMKPTPSLRPGSASARVGGGGSGSGKNVHLYGAHGMWREAPEAPQHLRPAPTRGAAAATRPKAKPPPPPPPPPPQGLQPPAPMPTPPSDAKYAAYSSSSPPMRLARAADAAVSDRWVDVLRPAITWLFGFVDTALSIEEGGASAEILEEHKRALADLCRSVGGLLRSSDETGLSTCMWRALVALLTHFTSRCEPLQSQLTQLRRDVPRHRLLEAKHAAERAEWQREAACLRRAAARDHGGGGGGGGGDAGISAAGSAAPPAWGEDAASAMHERLVAVTSQLVSERARNTELQRTVEQLREKANAQAALSRIATFSFGGDGAAGASAPPPPTAPREAQPSTIAALEEELERTRRRVAAEVERADRLEALRTEFMRRFSPAFVEQVEREQAMAQPGPPPHLAHPPPKYYAMTAKPGAIPTRRRASTTT